MSKDFEFPEDILKKINECSSSGFILFLVNEKGEPMVFHKFDNISSKMGLLKFAELWTSGACNEFDLKLSNALFPRKPEQSYNEDEDEDEDEDEEDEDAEKST